MPFKVLHLEHLPGWHLDKEPLAALGGIFHTVVLVLANAGHDLEDTCKKDEASVFAFYRPVLDCVSMMAVVPISKSEQE